MINAALIVGGIAVFWISGLIVEFAVGPVTARMPDWLQPLLFLMALVGFCGGLVGLLMISASILDLFIE